MALIAARLHRISLVATHRCDTHSLTGLERIKLCCVSPFQRFLFVYFLFNGSPLAFVNLNTGYLIKIPGKGSVG